MSDISKLTNEEFLLKLKKDDEELVELIDQVLLPLNGFPLSYAKMVLQTAIQRAERKAIIPN